MYLIADYRRYYYEFNHFSSIWSARKYSFEHKLIISNHCFTSYDFLIIQI